jgi:glucosamine 6-phosphate synthetase-like amidotransferase/phosphosugar isomerase protein
MISLYCIMTSITTRNNICVALSATSVTKKLAPVLLDGLKKLEYRGYDSAGIATQEADGVHL